MHTPGPWRAATHGGDFYVFGPEPKQAMIADHHEGDTPGIARMRGTGAGLSEAEREANAKLIAQAPDLLALWRAVRYALESGCLMEYTQEPQKGATTEDLIRWGAMRNLHDAVAKMNVHDSEVPHGR